MLLSVWLLAALVTAPLAAIAGWAALGLRRRRRLRASVAVRRGPSLWALRAGAVVVIAALVAVAGADAANRRYSYIPTFAALRGDVSPDLARAPRHGAELALGAPAAPDHGQVDKVSIPGRASGVQARTGYVYLPPAYFDRTQPVRRFPVLYLIHGSPGTAVDWLRGGYVDRSMDRLLAEQAINPFIVVLPDVNGGYRRDVECQDVPGGPQAQTYVVEDVVNWVDAHYRTLADRTGRAVGGLSTGGYCGVNLLLRHQDVFSAAVSHSGYGKPDHNAYTGDLFHGDNALRLANTPDAYLATIPLRQPLAVYLDAGATDGESLRESTLLYRVLHRRGVDVTLNIVRGESHDFVTWRRNLRLSLPWVSRWFAAQGASTAFSDVIAPDASDLPPPAPTDAVPARVTIRRRAGRRPIASLRTRPS